VETEFAAIRDDLQRLRDAVRDGHFPVKLFPDPFGAGWQGFRTHPPLSEEAVQAFEARHSVRLPTEYRGFLIHVGNGGAGPPYGLFKLGEYEGEPWVEGDWFVGVLSEPFPHAGSWNDLSGLPPWHESWPDDPNWDEAGYERQMEAWQARYWDTAHVNGAFPICHLGCNHRLWLVVTGAEAGNIWNDCRADQAGLYPLQQPARKRVSFLTWYRDWLATALERLS
jgi:hypothetical protein